MGKHARHLICLVITSMTCLSMPSLFAATVTRRVNPKDAEIKPTETPASTQKKPSAEDEDDGIIRKPKNAPDPATKDFSHTERNKACSKFDARLVSVGGEFWKVVKCVRHQVVDPDVIFKMSRDGVAVVEADSRDLAPIPIGVTWEALQNAKPRSCAALNGHYVTFSYTDVYFVERCIRRLVPDYTTLIQHRKSRGYKGTEMLALTDAEFFGMKQGRDIPSVIDEEFAKLLDGSAGVDIIPIDEACKGVEGKIVSFYARLYRIEKCKKREIDAEAYTMKSRNRDLKFTELRAEQWLSIPDGKPVKE